MVQHDGHIINQENISETDFRKYVLETVVFGVNRSPIPPAFGHT